MFKWIAVVCNIIFMIIFIALIIMKGMPSPNDEAFILFLFMLVLPVINIIGLIASTGKNNIISLYLERKGL